jgi:hypothetical protein
VRDFIPPVESEFVTWSTNFNARITATPTAFNLTTLQATAYGTAHDAFVTAYDAANNDGTRTPSAVISKNDAKKVLIDNARMLARIIQAAPSVTNTQKSDLGLTVHSVHAPIPAPAHAPGLVIEGVSGNTVRIRLIDIENPMRRGKPDGVESAGIFSFVGAAAPTEESAWNYEGNATRTVINVVFPPATAPGAKVWFTAYWINPRAQKGPSAIPVGTNIAGGAAMAA